MNFPHKCTRCGFCCLGETCPVGRMVYGIGKFDPCPALTFYGDVAECHAPAGMVPFGDGCCIKARVYRQGVEYDFAALPHDWKLKAVQQMIRRRAA